MQQQIAKITGIERFQPGLIEPVELLPLPIGIGLAVACAQLFRAEAFVLPAIDALRQQPRGPALVVHPFGLNELLEHAQLIVGIDDCIVGLEPNQFGMTAQQFGRDRVEGAEPRQAFGARAEQLGDPLFHLARGAVGESDAEDFTRPGAARANDMRQPRGQRRSLAGTGPGQHQHRAFGRQHSLALRRVQASQQGVDNWVRHGFGQRFGRWLHERTVRERSRSAQALPVVLSLPAPGRATCAVEPKAAADV